MPSSPINISRIPLLYKAILPSVICTVPVTIEPDFNSPAKIASPVKPSIAKVVIPTLFLAVIPFGVILKSLYINNLI